MSKLPNWKDSFHLLPLLKPSSGSSKRIRVLVRIGHSSTGIQHRDNLNYLIPSLVTTHCNTPPGGGGNTSERQREVRSEESTMLRFVGEETTLADRRTEIWLQERVSPTHNIPHPNTTTQQPALFNTSEREREGGQREGLSPADRRQFQGRFSKCHKNKVRLLRRVQVRSFQFNQKDKNKVMHFLFGKRAAQSLSRSAKWLFM